MNKEKVDVDTKFEVDKIYTEIEMRYRVWYMIIK